jgi:protein TonB
MYTGIVVEITKEKKPKKIYTKVEITRAFPRGDSSWVQSLEKLLNESIPVKNGAKAGKYIVEVRFLIERDGSLADLVCLKDPGYGMCQQVKGAIHKMFPGGWQPREVRQ